jgi:hypothetical protein
MTGEKIEIVGIDRREDTAASKVGDRNDERIDCKGGTASGGSEKLSGTHSHARIHWIHLHALAPKTGKDLGVRTAAANHFGENRGHGCHREIPTPHLRDQRADTIAPLCWTS